MFPWQEPEHPQYGLATTTFTTVMIMEGSGGHKAPESHKEAEDFHADQRGGHFSKGNARTRDLLNFGESRYKRVKHLASPSSADG